MIKYLRNLFVTVKFLVGTGGFPGTFPGKLKNFLAFIKNRKVQNKPLNAILKKNKFEIND